MSVLITPKALPTVISLHALHAEHCQPNWDGEDALPVSTAALDTAVSFIRALPEHLPMPEIAAEPDGSISLDWAPSKHCVFSISIGSTNRLSYAGLAGGEYEHGVLKFDGKHCPQGIIEWIEAVV